MRPGSLPVTGLGGWGHPCPGAVLPTRRSLEGYRPGPLRSGQPAPAKQSSSESRHRESATERLPLPHRSTRTSKLILSAKLINFPMTVCESPDPPRGRVEHKPSDWVAGEGVTGWGSNMPALTAERGCGARQQGMKWVCAPHVLGHSPTHPFVQHACAPGSQGPLRDLGSEMAHTFPGSVDT